MCPLVIAAVPIPIKIGAMLVPVWIATLTLVWTPTL